MAIQSAWHSPLVLGAINTSYSKTVKQVFSGPRNVWSHTALNRVLVYDDPAEADVYVRQFKDGNGTHDVHWVGFFSSDCTEITYKLHVNDAYCAASGITQFFG